MASSSQDRRLRRDLGLPGAVVLGLGSILGTGVFVSLGLAAETAGPAVLLAIVAAAALAGCNGLSSAQLAAAHPVSGGTYEYGYRFLNPALGFTAGCVFLAAKSASAATAALGFAGYSLYYFGAASPQATLLLALGAVALLTALVLSGLRRSNMLNYLLVGLTLIALGTFAVAGLRTALAAGSANWRPFFSPAGGGSAFAGMLEAAALIFVAYTGYGRIATLGEEVRDPARTIPRAVLVTLTVVLALYLAVAAVGIGAVGAGGLYAGKGAGAAPLERAARDFGLPLVPEIVALGAVAAMLGVLLNLILGLSRVALAMGRRGDLPEHFARLDTKAQTPRIAVLGVAIVIGSLVLIGDIRLTRSFSAFNVLIYYGLTNLAALRMPAGQRRYPSWIAAAGLAGCFFLAFWVEPRVWLAGLAMLAFGHVLRLALHAFEEHL